MKYRVLIEQDEDGIYVVECPALPGCVSQGKTREEALENIQDAMQGYLESLKKHGDPIPPSIQEAVVDVAIWAAFPLFQGRKLLRLSKKSDTVLIIKQEATSFLGILSHLSGG